MYEVTHTQVDSLLASFKCCKIEGSRPRTLPDRLFHLLCLVGLAYRNRGPSSASRNCVKSNGRVVGKASVRRLMDSPHRRIRAILQAKGGHMSTFTGHIIFQISYPPGHIYQPAITLPGHIISTKLHDLCQFWHQLALHLYLKGSMSDIPHTISAVSVLGIFWIVPEIWLHSYQCVAMETRILWIFHFFKY